MKRIHLGTIFCCSIAAALQPSVLPKPTTKQRQLLSQRSAVTFTDTIADDFYSTPQQQQLHVPFVVDVEEMSQQTAAPATTSSLVQELMGEALGTFLIVGVGSLASMDATFMNPFTTTLPEIALIWSTAVTTAIFMTGSVLKWGDAHFNPAITVAMATFRNFEWQKVIPYSLAQLAGSVMGSAASYTVYANCIRAFESNQGLIRASSMETARVFGEYFPKLTSAQAFGVEAFGAAVLAAVAFALSHPSRQQYEQHQQQSRHHPWTILSFVPVPVTMGATVFGLINVLAPFTQAGLNPARDFGPRLVAFAAGWTDVAFQGSWVYLLAPIVGALMGGAFVDRLCFCGDGNPKKEAGKRTSRI